MENRVVVNIYLLEREIDLLPRPILRKERDTAAVRMADEMDLALAAVDQRDGRRIGFYRSQ